LSAASEDNSKKTTEENDVIDKDTLIYIGAGAGLLGLVGVLAMAGMGWMKEQDQEKKRIAIQKQQLDMAQRALQQRQRQKPPEAGWPNPIPNNTVSPIMELPSEEREEEDQFVGYRNPPPPTAYNTNEQKFLVSDDIPLNNYQNYPVINPNASPQQIGSKISRVMSMDGANVPVQQSQPQQIRSSSSGDDAEDFSDLFN
jgi:hypothetical protein